MTVSTRCSASTRATSAASPVSPWTKLAVQHRAAKAGGQIVERDDALAALAELARDVAADVAGAAGDEDGSHRMLHDIVPA